MIFLFSAFTLLLALAAAGAAGLALLYTRRNSAILFRMSKESDPSGRQPAIRALSAEIERLSERIHLVESKSLEPKELPLVSGLASYESQSEPNGERDTTYEFPPPGERQAGRLPGTPHRNTGVASGVNYTRRARALKLLRRGDSAEQVAAALEMPLADVKLLAKVRLIAAAKPSNTIQPFSQNASLTLPTVDSGSPLPARVGGLGSIGRPNWIPSSSESRPDMPMMSPEPPRRGAATAGTPRVTRPA